MRFWRSVFIYTVLGRKLESEPAAGMKTGCAYNSDWKKIPFYEVDDVQARISHLITAESKCGQF